MNLFKDNENAPKIRFIRKNGRVIPIVQGKKVQRAAPLIDDRLQEMEMEVKNAVASGRSIGKLEDGTVRNFGGYSTYPKFYKELKFKNKSNFLNALKNLEGKKGEQLAEQAIDDLNDGYDSSFGRIPPNLQFRVMTKQTYDNTGVVFRRIDGKVRPLKIASKYNDEVPF